MELKRGALGVPLFLWLSTLMVVHKKWCGEKYWPKSCVCWRNLLPLTNQKRTTMEQEVEKTRYSDEELAEFRVIILDMLGKAKDDYELLRASVNNSVSNDTEDTSPTFKVLEEGAATLSKEEMGRLAQRQLKFIQHLEAALLRIENKTYGICRETGKLIPKERLKVVPHATLSVEAKEKRR